MKPIRSWFQGFPLFEGLVGVVNRPELSSLILLALLERAALLLPGMRGS
jgi:hypothetical protein